MPCNSYAGFRVRLDHPNHAINTFDELRLFGAQRVHVDHAICTRRRERCAADIERDLLDRSQMISEYHHVRHVTGVHDLDFVLTRLLLAYSRCCDQEHTHHLLAGHGHPLPIGRNCKISHGCCTAQQNLVHSLRDETVLGDLACLASNDEEVIGSHCSQMILCGDIDDSRLVVRAMVEDPDSAIQPGGHQLLSIWSVAEECWPGSVCGQWLVNTWPLVEEEEDHDDDWTHELVFHAMSPSCPAAEPGLQQISGKTPKR